MRFTRKYRNKAIGLQTLHKVLSRIDIEKDALNASVRIGKDNISYFHKCADRLFGELPFLEYKQNIEYPLLESSLKQSTQDFLNTLLRYKVYTPIQLVESHTYTDLHRQFMSVAPEIQEAIHDAGPDLKVVTIF